MSEDSVTIEFYARDNTLKKQFLAKTKDFTHLLYMERNCFSNCVKNMAALESLAGCTLELMAGSFGLCQPSPTWYEWGGQYDTVFTTVHQFSKCQFTGLPSVHFWFETTDGSIWDVLDLYVIETVAPVHCKSLDRSSFLHGCLIPGRSRKELKACGLAYVPASPLVQDILVRKHADNISVKF